MVYCTTTRILKDKTLENLEKELEILSKSKFNNINFNFAEFPNLIDDNVDFKKIATKCKELGLSSNVAHAPIHWPFTFNDYYDRPDKENLENRIIKSLEACPLFGIKWIVIHIGTYLNENGKCDKEKSIEHNKKYLEKFIKCAMANNVKIAIENGTTQVETETAPYAEELIELVDYFNKEYKEEILGICYDFGHGNVAGVNIYEDLKKIGNRLKVTHIHDNFGKDDHNFPFKGNIDWSMAMKGLKEIGYNGELNLEVRYNKEWYNLENKDLVPVELIDTTYNILEKLEGLM